METRRKPGRHKLDKDYEHKAKEILALASSLPKIYREKILNDLKHLDDPQPEEQKESHGPSSRNSINPTDSSVESSVRKSSRQSKKTEKALALEAEKTKHTTSSCAPVKVKVETLDSNDGYVQAADSPTLKQQSVSTNLRKRKQHKVDNTYTKNKTASNVKSIMKSCKRKLTKEDHDGSAKKPSKRQQTSESKDKESHVGACTLHSSSASQSSSSPVVVTLEHSPERRKVVLSSPGKLSEKTKHFQENPSEQIVKVETPVSPPQNNNTIEVNSDTAEGALPNEDVLAEVQENNIYIESETLKEFENLQKENDFATEAHKELNDLSKENGFEAVEVEDIADAKSQVMPQTRGPSESDVEPEVVPARKRRPKGTSTKSSHLCPECKQEWPTRDALRQHIARRHKGQYKCHYCGQTFLYKHTFDKHVELHDSGNFHKCPHCANMIKGGKERLEHHIRNAHVEKVTSKKKYSKCLECDETFRSKRKLHTHQLNEHGKHAFQCGICSRRFLYKGPYELHLEDHRNDKLQKCHYDLCNFHYKSELVHQTHVARVHEKNAPRPFMCDVCSRSFCEPRYLKSHMKCHKRDKKFVCETCMFETYTIQSLKTHLQRRHSMTLAHVCDICGAKLSSKTGLEDHLKRHYNKKDHACPVCDKAFVSKGQLAAHKKIHQEHSFACDVCQKTFVDKFKLAFHKRTHTNVKDFQCAHCTYACNLKCNLYKHMERVHHIFHPDKFSNYQYVRKLQDTTVNPSSDTLLELVHITPKTGLDNPENQQNAVVEQPAEITEQLDAHVYSESTGGTEQAEAAAVLAHMQAGQSIIKNEFSLEPQQETVINLLPETYNEIIKVEAGSGETCTTEEVVVDNVENVFHLVEDENVEYQQVEDTMDTMYTLQLEGSNETFTLNSQEMNNLAGSNIVTVEDGTVLIDSTGNVVQVIQGSL